MSSWRLMFGLVASGVVTLLSKEFPAPLLGALTPGGGGLNTVRGGCSEPSDTVGGVIAGRLIISTMA